MNAYPLQPAIPSQSTPPFNEEAEREKHPVGDAILTGNAIRQLRSIAGHGGGRRQRRSNRKGANLRHG